MTRQVKNGLFGLPVPPVPPVPYGFPGTANASGSSGSPPRRGEPEIGNRKAASEGLHLLSEPGTGTGVFDARKPTDRFASHRVANRSVEIYRSVGSKPTDRFAVLYGCARRGGT
jgi:hypothetical protein